MFHVKRRAFLATLVAAFMAKVLPKKYLSWTKIGPEEWVRPAATFKIGGGEYIPTDTEIREHWKSKFELDEGLPKIGSTITIKWPVKSVVTTPARLSLTELPLPIEIPGGNIKSVRIVGPDGHIKSVVIDANSPA